MKLFSVTISDGILFPPFYVNAVTFQEAGDKALEAYKQGMIAGTMTEAYVSSITFVKRYIQ